jgi:hypothetical protein
MAGFASGPGRIEAMSGGSAEAEYDRRLARHQGCVRRERPFLLAIEAVGALVAAVTFATGAIPSIGYGALVPCLVAIGRTSFTR